MNDSVPALGELIGCRLFEMLRAGHITSSIYQVAVSSGTVSLDVMRGYLDACYQLPGQ